MLFSSDARAVAVVTSVYTGAIVHSECLPAAAQLLQLPERLHDEGGASQHVYLLAPPTLGDSDTTQLTLLPDTPAARDLARAAAPTTFLWAAKVASGACADTLTRPRQFAVVLTHAPAQAPRLATSSRVMCRRQARCPRTTCGGSRSRSRYSAWRRTRRRGS